MRSDPTISIVIPVYNGSDYLKEAIDSALGQTYHNIEVIVVNDGSNDRGQTEAIARSYRDKIRYFCKENGGVATALNLGKHNMEGEWFAWLSHDDVFSPHRIEEDMAVLRENPQARVIFCKVTLINSKGESVQDVTYPIEKVTNPREALLLGGVNMCTITMHKSCFDRTGLFNESNRTTQDVEMTLRLSNIFPFYFNKNAVTYVRDHPNRGKHTLSEQHKKDRLLLCEFIHKELWFERFFPNLSSDPNEVADAWMWMRGLYQFLGSTHYANECHIYSRLSRKGFSARWIRTLQVLARNLPPSALSKGTEAVERIRRVVPIGR